MASVGFSFTSQNTKKIVIDKTANGSEMRRAVEGVQVHLWTALADTIDVPIGTCEKMLSKDEWTRANGFMFQRDRFRYIFAHAVLRDILAQYLDITANKIEFGHNEYGKPFVAGPGESIQFNMSHSGSLVAVGVSRDRRIGVDVEYVKEISEGDAIANNCFTVGERRLIAQSNIKRTENFYLCWTRKEAYVKALGTGLSLPLNSFDSAICPGERGRKIDEHKATWWVCDSPMPNGYVGSVGVEGAYPSLVRISWISFL